MNQYLIKLFATVSIMAAATANAGIISGTHTTDGGKSVALQGLEWMSLDYTAGLSRNTIESATGWTDRFGNNWASDEWRYATRSETEKLLGSLWDQMYDGWSDTNHDGANWFISNFAGLDWDTGFGQTRVDGKYNDASWTNFDATRFSFGDEFECYSRASYSCYGIVAVADSRTQDLSSFNVKKNTQEIAYNANQGGLGAFSESQGVDMNRFSHNEIVFYNSARPNYGSVLVRKLPTTSVLEPSSLAILALGMIGFAARRFSSTVCLNNPM